MVSIVYLLQWLSNAFFSVWSYIGNLWTRGLQFITEEIIDWLEILFIPVKALLEQTPWSSVIHLLNAVDYVIPIYAALGIKAAAYTVAGSIRLVRWILAIIPTIGG